MNNVLIKILIGIIMLGVIFSAVSVSTTTTTQSDTFTTPINNGTNLSLIQTNELTLISVTNSTLTTIPASNYTFYESGGFYFVTLDDNSSLGSSDSVIVTYSYEQAGYIKGIVLISLLLIIPIFLGIALIKDIGLGTK